MKLHPKHHLFSECPQPHLTCMRLGLPNLLTFRPRKSRTKTRGRHLRPPVVLLRFYFGQIRAAADAADANKRSNVLSRGFVGKMLRGILASEKNDMVFWGRRRRSFTFGSVGLRWRVAIFMVHWAGVARASITHTHTQ